ncbi:MAG: T6SS effector amidase Tae4 family protein [Moheibacter sp.]
MYSYITGRNKEGEFFGAVSGAAAYGVGELGGLIFTDICSSTATLTANQVRLIALAAEGGMHAVSQAYIAGLSGGDAGQGFVSGMVASAVASVVGSVGGTGEWDPIQAGSALAQILFGTVSGGISAELLGGNFWQGATIGLTAGALNHGMHKIKIEIQKTKIPSPEEIYNAYPENPYQQEFCASSENECAIRMSETLHKLGVNISKSNKYRGIHKEGDVIHQPSAKAMADWFWGDTELGSPKIMESKSVKFMLSDFKGKSGLIYFVHPEYGGTGPGHIDVIYNGNIGSGFYDNSKIWFWEFKNGKYVKN